MTTQMRRDKLQLEIKHASIGEPEDTCRLLAAGVLFLLPEADCKLRVGLCAKKAKQRLVRLPKVDVEHRHAPASYTISCLAKDRDIRFLSVPVNRLTARHLLRDLKFHVTPTWRRSWLGDPLGHISFDVGCDCRPRLTRKHTEVSEHPFVIGFIRGCRCNQR